MQSWMSGHSPLPVGSGFLGTEECSDPIASVVGYAIVPDLMEELGMRDFVEGIAEVEHDSICLVFLVDGSGPVVNAAAELSLAWQLLPESMLMLVQYVLLIQMPAYLAVWLHTTCSMVLYKIQVSKTGL